MCVAYLCLPILAAAALRGEQRGEAEDGEDEPTSPLFFWKTFAKFRSFSAVSAPIFASKYTFLRIFQNLPDYLAEIFEIWQNLQILRNDLQNVC